MFRYLKVLAIVTAFVTTLGLMPSYGSVSSGRVTVKFYPMSTETALQDGNARVEIVGDMTQWGSEAMKWSQDGYYYKDFNLAAGNYEYYVLLDGSAISNMRDYGTQFEPSPDTFLADGYGGMNAVLRVMGDAQSAGTYAVESEDGGPLVFRYYPNPLLERACGTADMSDPANRSVTITGDVNDWGDDDLTWNESEGCYEITYTGLESGDYEFYFSLCDDAINYMDQHEQYFEPKGVTFTDDGYGGSNAIVSYDSRQGPLVFRYYPNSLMDEDCEAAYSDRSSEPEVTITGDINDWDSDELIWNDELKCYEISYYRLREGDYEFYFSLCGDAIDNMKEHADYFEPPADEYVDDGYGGYNAVVHYAGDPNISQGYADGPLVFRYYPNPLMDSDCGTADLSDPANRSVTITGDMNDWGDDDLTWNESEGCYEITYTGLESGDYEFYFSLCDDAINYMDQHEEYFEPKGVTFTDDGYGGYNAVVSYDSRQGPLVFKYYPNPLMDSDCEAAYSDRDSESKVTITGDMNDWGEDPLDWNNELQCYEISYSGLREGDYEFYFSLCGDAINNMKEHADYFEPTNVTYVDDGYGGYNAVVYYAGDPNAGSGLGTGRYAVTFKFYPSDRMQDSCRGVSESDIDVTITGDMNDWDSEALQWDPQNGYWYITYNLDEGDYEFYFSLCGDAIDNMKYFARWYEPSADKYVDDGSGGYNAVISVHDDGHFYTRNTGGSSSYSGNRHAVVFRYYPSEDDLATYGGEAEDLNLEVTGDMNDWSSEEMTWNASLGCFEKTFDLSEGDYEFYFIIDGDAIDNMKWYARNFEPPADEYVDDGYGGYNAVVEVNDDLMQYYEFAH